MKTLDEQPVVDDRKRVSIQDIKEKIYLPADTRQEKGSGVTLNHQGFDTPEGRHLQATAGVFRHGGGD